MSQKIIPNLWFDTEAEEAAEFYVSVFKDGKILNVMHYPKDGPGGGKKGSVLTVEWELMGQRFVGINGGPQFKFSEAVSLQIDCEDQEEVDYYWDALLADGGEESMCGWLRDKYGLSWQVIPKGMDELFSDPDRDKIIRAWDAMMEMRKIDVAALKAAAEGEPVKS